MWTPFQWVCVDKKITIMCLKFMFKMLLCFMLRLCCIPFLRAPLQQPDSYLQMVAPWPISQPHAGASCPTTDLCAVCVWLPVARWIEPAGRTVVSRFGSNHKEYKHWKFLGILYLYIVIKGGLKEDREVEKHWFLPPFLSSDAWQNKFYLIHILEYKF